MSIWSGVLSSQVDKVVAMVCAAVDGFHPLVTYQWTRNGSDLVSECYSILYTMCPGDTFAQSPLFPLDRRGHSCHGAFLRPGGASKLLVQVHNKA